MEIHSAHPRNPADAEEVTLDAEVRKAWRTAPHSGLQHAVPRWLFKIMARTRLIDWLRSYTRAGTRSMALSPRCGPRGDSQTAPGIEREAQTAPAALAPEQREAIELAYWHGYSHAELAGRLGQPWEP